tara:strand:+ start:140 stop:1312 length:1173 start_codon:yes stop_codon:yes gene_type:complete
MTTAFKEQAHYRIPKSIEDLKLIVDSPGSITWEEANEWIFKFKFDFLQEENKKIMDELLKKGIHNFNLRIGDAKVIKGFKQPAQRFIKNYIAMPILTTHSRTELENVCRNLVENVATLTKDYSKNAKLNFDVATEELTTNLSIDILELLEQPSLENDIKVCSFLRHLGFPVQAIMILNGNKDRKSRLVIAAASLDLLTQFFEEEMKADELFENYSPFNTIEELKTEYQSLISANEQDRHVLNSYARFLLFQQDELDELYNLLLNILKSHDLDNISKKYMAQMTLTALQLTESKSADPILIQELREVVSRNLEIELDSEKVALITNFQLLTARLRKYKKNNTIDSYKKGYETADYLLNKIYPNLESNKFNDKDKYRIKLLKQFITDFKKHS